MSGIRVKPFETCLHLPDFHLLRADEMLANKRHGTANEASLLLSAIQRFPFQPDWPAYPKQLTSDVRLEEIRKDRSRIMMTDLAFWRMALAHAIIHNIKGRQAVRRDQGLAALERSVAHQLELISEIRRHFFRAVFHNQFTREIAGKKARKHEQGLWEHVRREMRKAGLHDFQEVRKLMKAGFDRHQKFWVWRLDNLYAPTETHGIVRVKHHGKSIESALAEVSWFLRHEVTQHHREWRLDDQYLAMPNGGIVHVHHANGQPLVTVAAHVHQRLLDKRRHAFEKWHDSVLLVPTANRGLVHTETAKQGKSMAQAFHDVELPEFDAKERMWLEWHAQRLLITLANGGYAPAHHHARGLTPEKVHGDVESKEKKRVTRQFVEWHMGHNMIRTANGGFAPLKALYAKTPEDVVSQSDKQKRHKTSNLWMDWHKSHLFVVTPNHMFAPLKGNGRSLELVSAEVADRPRKKKEELYQLWRQNHKFRETVNHGFAPLKFVGQSYEHVSYETWRRIADRFTKKFLDWHQKNLYVATGDHGWREIGRGGKTLPAIVKENAKPTEGPGALEPLPNVDGKVPTSVLGKIEQDKKNHKRKAIHQFQQMLAASEDNVSRLRNHVVLVNSNSETNEPQMPVEVAKVGGKKV